MASDQASRQKLGVEAHRHLPHANPLSIEQMRGLLETALARQLRTAVEVGCGAGQFALGLAERHDVRVIALDSNPFAIDRAVAALSTARLVGSVDFRREAAADFRGELQDLVVCIAASHAYGTPRESLRALRGLVKPTGTLVFADLEWSGKPPSDYLDLLQTAEDDYWTVEEADAAFAEAGWKVETSTRATADSWARYESGVLNGRLAFAETLPPEQAAEIARTSWEWFRSYEAHGRHCLGFAAFVATPLRRLSVDKL